MYRILKSSLINCFGQVTPTTKWIASWPCAQKWLWPIYHQFLSYLDPILLLSITTDPLSFFHYTTSWESRQKRHFTVYWPLDITLYPLQGFRLDCIATAVLLHPFPSPVSFTAIIPLYILLQYIWKLHQDHKTTFTRIHKIDIFALKIHSICSRKAVYQSHWQLLTNCSFFKRALNEWQSWLGKRCTHVPFDLIPYCILSYLPLSSKSVNSAACFISLE
jgi:hypothetical protein